MADPSDHATYEELLAVYALGALPADEIPALEEHLASCPACRAQLDVYRPVVEALAEERRSLPAPSPRPAVAGSMAVAERRIGARWAALVMTLALTLLVAVGGALIAQDRRLVALSAQVRSQGLASETVLSLAEPTSARVRLVSRTGQPRMLAVISSSGVGYSYGSALPVLPAGRTYQLWATTSSQTASLALLGPNPQIATFRIPAGARSLIITDEAKRGAGQPHTAPVASGSIE